MNQLRGDAKPQVRQIADILTLADRYAAARNIAARTLARQATGSSTWLERCAKGRVVIESAIGFVAWLSAHWPPGLEWPADIERPHTVPSTRSASRVSREVLTRAAQLGRTGEVASPGALCEALQLQRSVFYAVLRRYRDDVTTQRWPRIASASERMLVALIESGDVRFSGRRTNDAA